MEFEKRLERAIQRGQQARDAQTREELQRAMSDDDYRNLHSSGRIELSEHIDTCLRRVVDYFPGFTFQSIVTPDGWGAKVSRDDLRGRAGTGMNRFYSRLELLVRPYTQTRILELVARGTILNKEVLSRNHFQFLNELDLPGYRELIDQWVVEYAEKFAAAN